MHSNAVPIAAVGWEGERFLNQFLQPPLEYTLFLRDVEGNYTNV